MKHYLRNDNLVSCLESSVTDFGNIFHFRKDRPTALNSNIQITNSKQSANPNLQNSKQKHYEGSELVCYSIFGHWYLSFDSFDLEAHDRLAQIGELVEPFVI